MQQLEKYQNPITSQDHIKELQKILVQTCINYIKNHNLTDIDEINLHVDGLKGDSYKEGRWMPSTDSHIEVIGIKEGRFICERQLIGENY